MLRKYNGNTPYFVLERYISLNIAEIQPDPDDKGMIRYLYNRDFSNSPLGVGLFDEEGNQHRSDIDDLALVVGFLRDARDETNLYYDQEYINRGMNEVERKKVLAETFAAESGGLLKRVSERELDNAGDLRPHKRVYFTYRNKITYNEKEALEWAHETGKALQLNKGEYRKELEKRLNALPNKGRGMGKIDFEDIPGSVDYNHSITIRWIDIERDWKETEYEWNKNHLLDEDGIAT